MRKLRLGLSSMVLLIAACAASLAAEKAPDLRRAVPADAYLAVYGKHNPERDYQREYFKGVWQTVEETKIVERAAQIVTSQLSRDQNDQASALLAEIREAAAPIKLESLAAAQEVVYAQKMAAMSTEIPVPTTQHLLLLRLTPEAAEQTQTGVKNLFGLIEKHSQGKVSVKSASEHDASIITLALPPQSPFQPVAARLGDVLLLSSSEEFARQSLGMLARGEGACKFDDARLKEALGHLPAPEDSLVFYDARQQMAQLREIPKFIRSNAKGDKQAERISGLLEVAFDEFSVLDYQVTVEYTEGNLNRSVEYCKFLPGVQSKTFATAFLTGKPFDNWQSWVPANALSYSLLPGANLHPLYERIVSLIKERFPEAQQGLDKFEAIQTALGVHLDRDLLQAFSGERVSVSLPAASPTAFSARESMFALRCQKPERIAELLHRLVDTVSKQPAVAAQKLRLTKSDDLEGFETLSATALESFGVKPVIGFRDGWMIIASSADAVKKVFETKAGKSPSIVGTKAFDQFKLKVEGPVRSISYGNTAQSVRQTAGIINQVGTFAPMFLSMAAGKAKPEQLKPVEEALALLPSVAKIVSKFDFLEAKLSVVQPGNEPDTYLKRTAVVVRPPTR